MSLDILGTKDVLYASHRLCWIHNFSLSRNNDDVNVVRATSSKFEAFFLAWILSPWLDTMFKYHGQIWCWVIVRCLYYLLLQIFQRLVKYLCQIYAAYTVCKQWEKATVLVHGFKPLHGMLHLFHLYRRATSSIVHHAWNEKWHRLYDSLY